MYAVILPFTLCMVPDITRPNGELHVFEFDLEEGDICTVADSLWDNL